jgi:hypothetical protein
MVRGDLSWWSHCLAAGAVAAAVLAGPFSGNAASANAVSPRPTLGQRSGNYRMIFGLGTVAPATVNGNGDPNSIVKDIRWRGWGKASAHGSGKSYEFAASGGYLPGLFPVQLIATDLGHCTANGRLVYRHLERRDKGGNGRWSSWTAWPNLNYPKHQLLC